MPKISSLSLVRNPKTDVAPPGIDVLRQRAPEAMSSALALVERQGSTDELSYRSASYGMLSSASDALW